MKSELGSCTSLLRNESLLRGNPIDRWIHRRQSQLYLWAREHFEKKAPINQVFAKDKIIDAQVKVHVTSTKSAEFLLDLLKNAKSNTEEYKDLDVDDLVVYNIQVSFNFKLYIFISIFKVNQIFFCQITLQK